MTDATLKKKKAFNLSWHMVSKGLSMIIMAANMELEQKL